MDSFWNLTPEKAFEAVKRTDRGLTEKSAEEKL